MTLKRRERFALLALLVALCGLAVDKFLLPPPASASAHTDTAGAAAADAAGALPSAAPPAFPLGSRGAGEDGKGGTMRGLVADVFDRARLLPGGGRPKALAEQRAEQTRIEDFRTKHLLRATVLGPRPVALVSQRALSIGDALDGFVLESIGEMEAVFVSDGARVTLRVPAAGSGP